MYKTGQPIDLYKREQREHRKVLRMMLQKTSDDEVAERLSGRASKLRGRITRFGECNTIATGWRCWASREVRPGLVSWDRGINSREEKVVESDGTLGYGKGLHR
jgi:hypothetical protein